MPVVVFVVAFSEYLFIPDIVPVGVVQPVRGIEMRFSANCHSLLNVIINHRDQNLTVRNHGLNGASGIFAKIRNSR
jgi:hypothetical protein